MIKWDDAIKNALDILNHKENYAYFYGAKRQVLTDDIMMDLWSAYPGHFKKYDNAEKKKIFNYSRGKIGFDCSGFVAYCINSPYVYSGALINDCSFITDNMYSGVAGSILWKPNHVAIDIGYGFFLHFPSELHTCELGRFKENTIHWEKSGQSKYVDYEGANNR